jgi:hypothetical protein
VIVVETQFAFRQLLGRGCGNFLHRRLAEFSWVL